MQFWGVEPLSLFAALILPMHLDWACVNSTSNSAMQEYSWWGRYTNTAGEAGHTIWNMNTNTGGEAGNKAFEAMTPLLKAGKGGSEKSCLGATWAEEAADRQNGTADRFNILHHTRLIEVDAIWNKIIYLRVHPVVDPTWNRYSWFIPVNQRLYHLVEPGHPGRKRGRLAMASPSGTW